MMVRKGGEAYQKAARNLHEGRIINGQHYIYYGASDTKKGIRQRAKKHFDNVVIQPMPKIIRNTDPKAAKYAVFVRKRKIQLL